MCKQTSMDSYFEIIYLPTTDNQYMKEGAVNT